jgi:MFS family permease
LAVTLISPVFAIIAGALMERHIPPPQYVLLVATCLVALAIGLISSLQTQVHTPPSVYGYQIILGAGLGAILPAGYMLIKLHVPHADLASATGATNFARAMGGTIGVSICTALFHDSLNRDLPDDLSKIQVAALEQSLSYLTHLPPSTVISVRHIFGQAYNRQFRVMLAFAVANILVAAGLVVAVKRRGDKQPVQGVESSTTESNDSTKDTT